MQRVRGERRLRARDVATLGSGWHEDGGGLRLVVESSGTRHWAVRVTAGGKRRTLGLGSFPVVGLEEARDRALDIRRAARGGRELRQAKSVTFRQAFEAWFEVKQRGLTDAKYVKRVPAMMRDYVLPHFGDRPVAEITHIDVLRVLEPIWFTKPNLAQRVLEHLESVFRSATLRGQRTSASPCLGVAQELGIRRRDVQHRRALPYREVPAFIQEMRSGPATPVVKLCLEWTILTAVRSAEARGAMWSEIDGALWTIPRERMRKTGVEHVVPLSQRCLAILEQARALNPGSALIFPGKLGRLSDVALLSVISPRGATVHGFRSSFKDWA
ncbi:MAG: tyrosine-type recombinase/integrase, partial [Hyphomicrobiaceae bacterium]